LSIYIFLTLGGKKENHLLRSGIILITRNNYTKGNLNISLVNVLSYAEFFSKLHWKKISNFMKVNGFVRTWFECKYHWLLHLGKKIYINLKRKWTFKEDSCLINLIQNLKKNNWIQIAKEMNKKKLILIDIDLNGKIRPKRWKKVRIFNKNNFIFLITDSLFNSLPNYFEILKIISRREYSSLSCFRRYTILQKEHNKQRWYKDKDDRLRKAVWKYGEDWLSISQQIEKITPSQCKNRWYRSMTVRLGEKSQLNWTSELDLCLIIAQIFYFKVNRSIRDGNYIILYS